MSDGYTLGVFERILIVRPRDPAERWIKVTVLDITVPVLNGVRVHPDAPRAEIRVGPASADVGEASTDQLEREILATGLTIAQIVERAEGDLAALEAEANHLADLVVAWHERETGGIG